MPWQGRRNTVLAEASTERDIRTPLDNRSEKNRQLGRSVTIVTIEENDDVGRICRSQPTKARPSIPAARFLNDARPILAAISSVPSFELLSTTMTFGTRSDSIAGR